MSTRATVLTGLAGAALLAGGVMVADSDTCARVDAWVPCADAQALDMDCDGGIIPLRILLPIAAGTEAAPAPGTVIASVSPVACDGEAEVLPIDDGPLVGLVARSATEETPAEEMRLGVCEGAGCYCVTEPCEHILAGDPQGSEADALPYWCRRLRVLHPEAVCP